MERIDPWETQAVGDYAKLLGEFGIQDFKPLAGRIPDPLIYMRRI